MDGQECLRTPSSYLCFSHLKLYSCYITKFDQVRFEPLCVRSTRSPRFVIDLNFQNLFVHFVLTEKSISVKPRSLSWSRFSSQCNRLEHFGHTELQQPLAILQSRCHRVVPLGHTDRVRIYIPMGEILEISSKLLNSRVSCSATSGLRIIFSSPATSHHWFPSPPTDFNAAVAAVENSPPN